jgi:ribosomal protein S18 acetylase RimI-like enzyme
MISHRAYAGAADRQRILQFVRRVRPKRPHSDHLGDYLWSDRVPAPEPTQNIRLWEDEAGMLVAFSRLHTHWQTLSYEVMPGHGARELEQQVVAWSLERLAALAVSRPPDWTISANVPESDTDRLDLVIGSGFRVAEDHAWQLVRPLREVVSAPVLPDGFTVRALEGEHEAALYVEAHRDAWQPRSTMTAEMQLRLMHMEEYRPDLNLVVVAPDGAFAATMIGWWDGVNRSAEIEPLGTRPRFRRLGLARAIVQAGLRRFQSMGAETAEVWGVSKNPTALHLYSSLGFEKTAKVLSLERSFSPP